MKIRKLNNTKFSLLFDNSSEEDVVEKDFIFESFGKLNEPNEGINCSNDQELLKIKRKQDIVENQ